MKVLNRIIEYSFYAILLLVPLVFSESTSELFEMNKMWLTWGFAIIIAVAWGSKIILMKRFHLKRTPLDIPIMIFLASQVLATLFSLDPQVSWWGYYSRWNGGLLSTITYIFLYYAFVSNLELKHVFRSLLVSLGAGLLTALWGFPAHYGYDPTCLMFRGTLDTSCWTEAFKPTVRTFSTLGQPAWFAAYLALLIPIAMAYALTHLGRNNTWKFWGFFAIAIFMYINLNFANTRAGFIAFWVGNALFWAILFYKHLSPRKLFIRSFAFFTIGFIAATFIFGGPLGEYYKYTLPGITSHNASKQQAAETKTPAEPAAPAPPTESASGGGGITDSAVIRKYVWQGAIDAWKANPIFGTGVETFAYAYYKYKPAGQNLTSEWDYLYNKAHNEYLNYLATTGIVGLGSYLAFIFLFLFLTGKWLVTRHKEHHTAEAAHHQHEAHGPSYLPVVGLLAGFITILITNFSGFSVVIMNIYLFLVPLFILLIAGLIKESHAFEIVFSDKTSRDASPMQYLGITILILIGCYFSYQLIMYREADKAYALGNNLNKVGEFVQATPHLRKAVETVPGEPVYKDELSINLATLASAMQQQKEFASQAEPTRNTAIALSDQVTSEHPNNIPFLKNRVRVFYTLAQSDPANQAQYLNAAALSINKAAEYSPNDARIQYNLGVLYGQTGNLDKGIEILKKTVALKPDYRDAWFALGILYHTKATDKDGKVIDPASEQQAIQTYEHILKNISPNDKQVKQSLNTWKN